jgi:hypothetical protein
LQVQGTATCSHGRNLCCARTRPWQEECRTAGGAHAGLCSCSQRCVQEEDINTWMASNSEHHHADRDCVDHLGSLQVFQRSASQHCQDPHESGLCPRALHLSFPLPLLIPLVDMERGQIFKKPPMEMRTLVPYVGFKNRHWQIIKNSPYINESYIEWEAREKGWVRSCKYCVCML